MQFALKYVRPDGKVIRTAPQDSISLVREMADYYENMGCEIIAFIIVEPS